MITLSPPLPFSSQSKGKQPEQQQQSIPISTRTPLLQSLLKVSRQSISTTPSNCHSYIVSSFDVNQIGDSSANTPIEELSWSENKVIWSKGSTIYRTYSFKEQGQRVTQALFATFEVYENKSTPNEASPIASTSAKSLDHHHSFGPFHRTPPPAWTDDPLPLPIHPTPTQTASPPKLERFLVIFLSDIAFAYPPGGSSIPFQLPFHLRRAWALDIGLLLERAQEGGELFDEDDPEGGEGELPTLYSLLDPADEIKAVSSTGILKGLFPSTKLSVPNPKLSKGGNSEPIQDLKEGIVFVSDRKDGSEPILVSLNKRSKRISVWSYGKVIEENLKEKSGKGKGVKKDEGSNNLAVPTTSTSKNRQSSIPTTGAKRKRQSSISHPDRISRRTSTGNNNTGVAGTGLLEEADLLEVLGDSLGTSMKRTASTHNANSVDRRTSVSRNELSITMDRMALSVGAGLGGVGMGGVTGMGEMDREWTIVMERDEERMVSDVFLEKVWELQIPESSR